MLKLASDSPAEPPARAQNHGNRDLIYPEAIEEQDLELPTRARPDKSRTTRSSENLKPEAAEASRSLPGTVTDSGPGPGSGTPALKLETRFCGCVTVD